MDIVQNKQITVALNIISGGPLPTNSWYIDNVLQDNTTDILIITPYQLTLGPHIIKYNGQNYCGNNIELIQDINIIEGEIMYTQTDPITVNQGTMTVTVTLRRTSNVTITVHDELGQPVQNATESIGTISGTTDVNGVVTLLNVPYQTGNIITEVP